MKCPVGRGHAFVYALSRAYNRSGIPLWLLIAGLCGPLGWVQGAVSPPAVLHRVENRYYLQNGQRVWETHVYWKASAVRGHAFGLKDPNRWVWDVPTARCAPRNCQALLRHAAFGQLPLGMHMRIGVHRDFLRLVWEWGGDAGAAWTQPVLQATRSPAGTSHWVWRSTQPWQGVVRSPAFTVAIDAGHGGHDPGAVGLRGLSEKHVTLAVSRQLARYVNRHPNMRAVLVRDTDRFIPLRNRVTRARALRADALVSIHADGFTDPKAQGASVFTLSSKGASSELGLWLAQKENRSTLIGGLSLGDKDDALASVLLDLSQAATLDASYELGQSVLRALGSVTALHRNAVEQAGFVILKSPDVPSILVEVGFISHPVWERKLASTDHQKQLARAIFSGIEHYYQQRHRSQGIQYAQARTP